MFAEIRLLVAIFCVFVVILVLLLPPTDEDGWGGAQQ